MIFRGLLSVQNSRLLIHLNKQLSRFYRYGIFGTIKRIFKKLLAIFLSILFLPLSVVLFFLGYRRLDIFTDRIGHLASEPDTLLKAQHLGLIEPKKWLILAPDHRVANQHLLQYWKGFFRIYQGKLTCFLLSSIFLWPFTRYNVSHFINKDNHAQFAYHVNKEWGTRAPLLQLSAEDNEWGNTQLAMLGLPPGAWFVCVHAREGGFSPVDENIHAHRNGKIENLIPAIEEIVRRGGWVIRLGDPTMIPLKNMKHVIDYTNHALRHPRLDIILCARARFILGNTSGIFLVASIFGIPSALANMIPFPTLGLIAQDLSIPKHYFSKDKNRLLTFKEIMQLPISTYRTALLYAQENMDVIENNPEDILLLTTEMLDRLDGQFIETAEDIDLHQKYMSLFKPHHYSYGACSKVSYQFLRRCRHLLGD